MEKEIEKLVEKYYEAIMLLQEEKDIIESLPTPEYKTFFSIINGLIEYIDKEMIEKQQEISLYNIEDKDLQEIAKEDLKLLQLKKQACLKRKSQVDEIVKNEEEAKLNPIKNLIFAKTSSNNVYAERDLKSFSEEYLDSVIESLQALENGFEEENIQKGRSLSNNNKLSGLHEIKPFKVRIFYRILSSDTVYVLLLRMKKSDNSKKDRDEAISRKSKTNKEFEMLRELVKDPQYKEKLIEEHSQIKNEIYEIINSTRRGRNV